MYEVFIDGLEVTVSVGLLPHERIAPQKVEISLRARGQAPLRPESLSSCIDYSLALEQIQSWPGRAHVDLLETLAAEIVEYLFTHDAKIDWVEVTIAKTDFTPNARRVGVRRALTREEFEAER
ncbi:hypothetical protein JCM16106_19280 [Hydrogenophilus islandicus]